jgi:hypothetical protein
MADRARDRDRELTAGIEVAEDRFCNRDSHFLAQVPAFVDYGHFSHQLADRKWSPVEQNRNDGFARAYKRIDQFILLADELQACSIAEVISHPGFARGLLVATDDEDNDISSPRDLHGLGDTSPIFLRIAGHNFVLGPRTALRNLTTLVVQNFYAIPDASADAVEHRRAALGTAAVAAQQFPMCIGANYGNRFDFCRIERRQTTVVLQ